MGLPQDFTTLDTRDVYGLDDNKTNLVDCMPLDVMSMGKSLTIDFLRMDYKSPLMQL